MIRTSALCLRRATLHPAEPPARPSWITEPGRSRNHGPTFARNAGGGGGSELQLGCWVTEDRLPLLTILARVWIWQCAPRARIISGGVTANPATGRSVKYHAGKSNSAALLEFAICDAMLACASALSKEAFDPERQLADAHA